MLNWPNRILANIYTSKVGDEELDKIPRASDQISRVVGQISRVVGDDLAGSFAKTGQTAQGKDKGQGQSLVKINALRNMIKVCQGESLRYHPLKFKS